MKSVSFPYLQLLQFYVRGDAVVAASNEADKRFPGKAADGTGWTARLGLEEPTKALAWLAEVAHAVGLSPAYFSRRYRRVHPRYSG